MAQSLVAIAAFVAVIGSIIFGVSRYEKSTKQEDAIALVTPPAPEPVVTEPVAVESGEPVATDDAAELVREPVSERVAAEAVPLATERSSAIAEIEPRAEVVEITLPPAIHDPKRLDAPPSASVSETEPRAEVLSVTIPPTIQDPKRPNDGQVEDLTQDILAWGQSKDLKYVAKLMQYATHADPIVRSHVAAALGQIVGAHPVRDDVERSIPVLGKLTHDSDLKVRLYAVQSLGMIRSQKVLPYLEKALLSPSGSVMKAANSALQNLKLQYGKTPSMQIAQQMLEKRKKA